MRDWQRNLLIVFCPLLVLAYFFVEENKKAEVSHKSSRSIASIAPQNKKTPLIKKTAGSRKIATQRPRSKKYMALLNRVPQSIEDSFKKISQVKISAGYELLEDVAALPEDRFDPTLGSVIQKREGLVYFRAQPGHLYVPVALSKSTNILYPISSVLHIKGATPDVRSELLATGHVEYYYHPPLKLLSLQTKSGEVLKVYSRLQKAGYKVELEVLKPEPQTF